MPPKRMTANPAKPARYRAGKPAARDVSSEEEDESDEEEIERRATPPPAPQPKPASLPSDPRTISNGLRDVELNERRRYAAVDEAARLEAERARQAKEEEGFVTEESDEGTDEEATGEGEDVGDDDDEKEEEESSDEEQPRRVLLRPTFIKKDKRKDTGVTAEVDDEESRCRTEEERKRAADELVQDQLRKDAEAKAASRKYWDDEEVADADDVDDTDGLDPEAELAAWKLRELKRVKRDREAIEQAEREREEVERRRNLTAEEREAEDKDFIARQKEDKDAKGSMSYMQKYFHKGAFFQDDAKAKGLDRRDIMGSRYQDDVNRELLPQYMQIRDMTRLGRKGRTKYKDMKSEDTGRWGQFDDRRPRGGGDRDGGDERFMPDREERSGAPTGANRMEVRERKTVDGAPEGPKAMRASGGSGGGDRADPARQNSYRPSSDRRHGRDEADEDYGSNRRREGERSSRRYSPRRRSRSRTRSRSRSPRGYRDSYRDDRSRRKRSPSPYRGRYDDDKRRRVDVR